MNDKKQTRADMIEVLTTMRPDTSRVFWETFDDDMLAMQVKLVRRQYEQQTADMLATI